MHRLKADEAYQVGKPGEPIRSYLNIDGDRRAGQGEGRRRDPSRATASSRRTPTSPGPATRPGITFVGPRPELLDLLGDKVAARKLAREAGVPVLSGSDEPGRCPARRPARWPSRSAIPVIVKASMGGGGRGMRVVESADALDAALDQARREAGTAFGVPDVFLEKFIRQAKHIEVQLLGDRHGNLVHLFERDCSVQRRHQKIVEIAPAPNLDPAVRAGDLRRRRRGSAGTSATTTPAPSSSCVDAEHGPVLLHRGQPADPGRAHRHRDRHRHRPGQEPDPDRPGRRRSPTPRSTCPTQDAVHDARLRLPVPGHDRGPREQVHARLRPDHPLPLGRRPGHPARRRPGDHRRRSSRRSTTRCW